MAKKIVSLMLVLSLILPGTVPVYASEAAWEEEPLLGTADADPEAAAGYETEDTDQRAESPVTVIGTADTPQEATVRGTMDAAPSPAEELPGAQEAMPVSEGIFDAQAMIDGCVGWWKSKWGSPIMGDTFLGSVSSTATDWTAFDLGRLGLADNFDGFLNRADLYVRQQYAAHPQTGVSQDSMTATDFHRLAMAILAAGGDPTKIGGHDLIADGTYSCILGEPWTQGMNGAVWALITLDAMGYETPEGAEYDRETLIGFILGKQLPDGGWPLMTDGKSADLDITGMAVTALAPYYAGDADVAEAVDSALNLLRSSMWDGGYLGNCEATVWAIVAFLSMGIDPASVTNSVGKSLLTDGLLIYYNLNSGGFFNDWRASSQTGDSNAISTDQGMYALIAYQRFLENETNLFDLRQAADGTQYLVEAGGLSYTAAAAADAEISLPAGTEKLRIADLPMGSYDAAEVRVDGQEGVWKSSFRRADGTTPVEGEIPVSDCAVLRITVHHRDKADEVMTLTVHMAEGARAQAVASQIEKLPDAEELTASDKEAVLAARAAYDGLADEEKAAVANYDKLLALEAKLTELLEQEEKELDKKRSDLRAKAEAVKTPVHISDEALVNQYLRELEELGDWEGKETLKALLEKYKKDIEKRKETVDGLDRDIWDKIDPLRVSQKDAAAVKGLMERYAALYEDERELLEFGKSLLDADAVVTALQEGTIPARVFQNIRSTGETFTYTGKLSDGSAYTLTYDGKDVQSAGTDVDARVRISSGSSADGAAACVEFCQEGSMNGNAALQAVSSAASGSYGLYWFNPQKVSIQSAGNASIQGGRISMTASMGGRYWLASSAVRLDGNSSTGGVSSPVLGGDKSSSGKGDTKASSGTASGSSGSTGTTTRSPASTGTTTRSSGSTGTTTRSSGSTGTTSKSSGSTSSGSSSDKTNGIITSEGKGGVVKAEEFRQIRGEDRNLKVKGKAGDAGYSFTFNGQDLEKMENFNYEIKLDCHNAHYIRELAEDPLILCMEGLTFPGKALFSIETELEDDTYLLFRYDPDAMKAEYVKRAEAANGKVQFTVSEGGDYFVAKRAKAKSLKEDAGTDAAGASADAGSEGGADPWNGDDELVVIGSAPVPEAAPGAVGGAASYALALLAAAGAICGAAYVYDRKKKKGVSDEREI